MENSKILIELDAQELTNLIKKEPELFIGETLKEILIRSINKEYEEKTGEKYNLNSTYQRWSKNPGSININNEKIKIDVPRMRNKQTLKTEEPEIYREMKKEVQTDRRFLRLLVNGLSQRKYKEAAQLITKSFGLSQSRISRLFSKEAEEALKEFESRDLWGYDFIALVIDGKSFSKQQIVHAVGITSSGIKIMLGFIHTTTENSQAIKGLLKNLIERNFSFEEGILVVSDGSKGIRKATEEIFGQKAAIQRCQWHKRENVISYLSDKDKEIYKGKLQQAYEEPIYETARASSMEIYEQLNRVNRSANNALLEGLEETLTIHRLGLREELGRSFCTTNIIENINSQLSRNLRNVKRLKDTQMQARWVSISLLNIEQNMNRVRNYKKLILLRDALKSLLEIEKRMLLNVIRGSQKIFQLNLNNYLLKLPG